MYRYNAPWIEKQIALYFLVSAVSACVYLLSDGHDWIFSLYGLFNTVLGFMFIWAPIVLLKGGEPAIVDRLIPVGVLEKFVFYLSYMAVVSIVILAPNLAVTKIIPPEDVVNGEIAGVLSLSNSIPVVYKLSQWLTSVAAMLTCLYCVLGVKRYRVKAWLLPIAVLVVSSVLQSLYVAATTFAAGFKAGMDSGARISPEELTQEVVGALNSHTVYNMAVFVTLALYTCWILWRIYRSLYRRNL